MGCYKKKMIRNRSRILQNCSCCVTILSTNSVLFAERIERLQLQQKNSNDDFHQHPNQAKSQLQKKRKNTQRQIDRCYHCCFCTEASLATSMEGIMQLAYDATVKLMLSALDRNLLPDAVTRKLTRLLLANRLRSSSNTSSELQLSHLLHFAHCTISHLLNLSLCYYNCIFQNQSLQHSGIKKRKITKTLLCNVLMK